MNELVVFILREIVKLIYENRDESTDEKIKCAANIAGHLIEKLIKDAFGENNESGSSD